MATKKAATRRAAPVAVKDPLANKGAEILKKYRLRFDGTTFVEDPDAKPDISEFQFFQDVDKMPGTCAVYVLSELLSDDAFDDLDLPPDVDLFELFKYSISKVLENNRRKQLVATTVHYQTKIAGYLEAVGFKNAGTSENPSSGNDVTIWVLNT